MDEIKEGFNRQRRNLLGITVVIFLAYFWGVDFKTVNILGNTIDLHQSDNVYKVLWALLFYWSLRYRNYLRELGRLAIADTLWSFQKNCLLSWLDKKRIEPEFWKNSEYTIRGQGEIVPDDVKRIFVEDNGISFFTRWVKLFIHASFDPVEGRGDVISISLKLPLRSYLAVNFRALWVFFNDSRLFTEYVFPPMLTFGFVMYWLFVHLLPDLNF